MKENHFNFRSLATIVIFIFSLLLVSCDKDKEQRLKESEAAREQIATDFVNLYAAEFPNKTVMLYVMKLNITVERTLLEFMLEKSQTTTLSLPYDSYTQNQSEIDTALNAIAELLDHDEIIEIQLQCFKESNYSMLPDKEKDAVKSIISGLERISKLPYSEQDSAFCELYEENDNFTYIRGSDEFGELVLELSFYEFPILILKPHHDKIMALMKRKQLDEQSFLKTWLELSIVASNKLNERIMSKAEAL